MPAAAASDSWTPLARFSSTGNPGKQLPMMTLPVVLAPPSFSRTFWPRMRPLSTDRSPTYGALTDVTSRLNCTTGVPASTISLRPLDIDSPGTDVAMPWTPAATSVWTALSCASASPPSGPVTCSSTLRSSAAAFAPSMICWMNGLPSTWVTNPILIDSGTGVPDGATEAGASLTGATLGGAADGAVVVPPPVLQAANSSMKAASSASQVRFVVIRSSY